MNKKKLIIKPLITMFCICMLGHSSISYACHMLVRFESYAALARLDTQENWQGLDIELVKILLTESGCSYEFVAVPLGRALRMLEQGELDLMLVSKTDKRGKYAHFIGPQRMEKLVVVTNNDTKVNIDTWEKLFSLSKPIAIQRGAFYGEEFTRRAKALGNNEKFIVVPDNIKKVELLQKGRIAGFFEEDLNIAKKVRINPNLKNLKIHSLVLNEEPVFYAFSKQSVDDDTLLKIKAAYKKLNDDGTFKGIIEKVRGKYLTR